jgi:two-component system cell cycle response regulator DivK
MAILFVRVRPLSLRSQRNLIVQQFRPPVIAARYRIAAGSLHREHPSTHHIRAFPMTAGRSSTSSGVVLLVQPERDDREMYAEFLSHAGLTPIVVSDTTPALALAPDADIIVTALLLPGQMDGIEFIERLKRDDRMKAIPIIVLTSSAWSTERARAASAGCDVFLAKPCLPDVLLQEIFRLMRPAKMDAAPPQPAKAELREGQQYRRNPRRRA